MEDTICKVAMLGVGTVGSGVYEILQKQKENLPFKTGSKVEISKIFVRNIDKYKTKFEESLLTTSWEEIVNDEEIKIVVEVMGGIEPAKTFILEALHHGKNVVTANKDLMALHGHELLKCAEENRCDLLFEAAVAGAIPIIRPMKQCLLGNEIDEVMGIMNGTTNFILTKMTEENMDFKEALALATELGYAEADPTADIEGHDAGRKVAILASIAFHTSVTFDDVYMEGISRITSEDIQYARELGYEIKLLGVAKNGEDGVEAHVHPTMIAKSHPLASVKDSFNAIFVHGDAVGDSMFYGRGAGSLPTGSAIVGDILDIVRNIHFNANSRVGCTCYNTIPVKAMEDTKNSYYVRIKLEDKTGTLAQLSQLFANHDVNISKLLQKHQQQGEAEVVVITYDVVEKDFKHSLKEIETLAGVKSVDSVIRVYREAE